MEDRVPMAGMDVVSVLEGIWLEGKNRVSARTMPPGPKALKEMARNETKTNQVYLAEDFIAGIRQSAQNYPRYFSSLRIIAIRPTQIFPLDKITPQGGAGFRRTWHWVC